MIDSAAVSTHDLTKWYYDASGRVIKACTELTFEARRGEVFGILGTNGAGKTTTLRLLSTVLKPTSGTATINGHSILKNPDVVRRNIGFISSDTGVYGRLTAREMIRYFGTLHGISNEALAARIEEIADYLDMRGFLDQRCEKLSTGQKQRVGIARTIVHNPSVLILDEPTAGLDVLASSQINELVRKSREQGCCVLLSTHNMSEARKLCDRILIIHQGKACAVGTLNELSKRFSSDDLEVIFLNAIGKLPSTCVN